uniref:Glycoprotein 16 n=1 Tax=Lymantria dispar multicapsid nuclear polyhedrosis virus TaxID=10449 RepID=A0A1B1MR09_NPVLD|nr:glycoprotein 16 [Lymantria dispar multiple nucleopolyhedrovirus]
MNYSTVILILAVAYVWHAGSLAREIVEIKRLLVAVYERLVSSFDGLTDQLDAMRNETVSYWHSLNEKSQRLIELVAQNGQKIDTLNCKVDAILQNA